MGGPRDAPGFEISVKGGLGEAVLGAFPDLTAEGHGDETVLVGRALDQAGLFAVLARIEALGLELLEVRRLTGGSGGRATHDG